ncbi:hypothetical protein [Azotobacter beijerinckii]|uniref:Uncharacterized protein n=1 Tax=Azotobacter beijerinckii TaxID=170623 RepID=A0A1I0ZWQ1_9GAMM|nr:hypothetical protein [Azotobacter beijerinckii]SFB30184.1 hypothetical protein SAMN04244571_02152 [Azotobacter beijerinckii]
MNSTEVLPRDYREQMQKAALEFLCRHQGEHLGDELHLFERTCDYLVNRMEVPAFMALRLAHLAMTQLAERPGRIVVDRAASDAERACLVNSFTGESAFVPLRLLPHRLQVGLAATSL